MVRNTLLALLASTALLSQTPPAAPKPTAPAAPAAPARPLGLYATITTSMGPIVCVLYEKESPITVKNFVALARGTKPWTDPKTKLKVTRPLYSGTTFHRVIPGFMIQGGGFTAEFVQKPPSRPPLQNEAEQSSKAGLLNVPGTVAMARTGDPNSATTQFFINVADNKFLNFREATPQGYGYTVFGKVVDGMDVVQKIAAQPTGAGGPFPKDVPNERVTIKSASVVSK